MTKSICVIGGGKWGQNHIRTLSDMGCLGGIVEADSARLSELLTRFPVAGFTSTTEALAHGFDGYTIAAPAPLHYDIAKQLLENGQHVLVEKPMTLSAESSKALVEIARQHGANLMVGHVLLFHPAIRKIKALIDAGKVGQLHYLYSTRLNLGTVRTEENVLWSFAPHDISVLDYLVGQPADNIEVKGSAFLQPKVHDFAMMQLAYPNNVQGHIFVSWLHPFKEQRLVIVGSRGMIVFEDSSAEKEILFYNKQITWSSGNPVKVENPTETIPYEKSQPLAEELRYFVTHLDDKITVADGRSGYNVVKALEEGQKQIEEYNPRR